MSRYYSMTVTITGYQADRSNAICEAASEEWSFDDWYASKEETLSSSGDGNLCGGESEDEFSRRFTHAIWKANKGFCGVSVVCTCMENMPYEEYEFDNKDYQRFIENKESSNP